MEKIIFLFYFLLKPGGGTGFLGGVQAINSPKPEAISIRGEKQETALAAVYDELRRMAAAKMAQEGNPQTLQPTALVHEAWLRLGGSEQPAWNSRAHFFGAAAEAMRRILVERARARNAQRRGSGAAKLNIDSVELFAPEKSEEILLIDEALDKFSSEHPEKAELVKLRFFAGLQLKEAAALLDISEPTAKRWWAYSRAWLFDELSRERGGSSQMRG